MSETTDKASMTDPAPFGPGFSKEKADAAERMEVWGSSFTDSSPDFCEFRLFDDDGRRIASRRVAWTGSRFADDGWE